jgi:hypothetical protein
LGASCLTTTNALAEPTDTETWANFGANFMFATGSGGSDAGIDAPNTSVGDAATGSDGSGGSAGGATGSGGRDSGTGGASGTACTPGQAPTNFGNVANGDPNPNYTSGVGVLTATEFLTFNGYVGPDSTDGGVVDGATATLVNRIDVQHFDPITGNSKGSATPLLAAGGDGGGFYINGADIAPGGEIAIIYNVHAASGWGVFVAFLDKNLALKKTNQFVAWGSANYANQSCVKSLNGQFVATSVVATGSIKFGKFGVDGSNAGGTNAIPTDDPSGAVFTQFDWGEGEVAFSGGTFAVPWFGNTMMYFAKLPYLTLFDTQGGEVGNPVNFSPAFASAQGDGFVAIAGTSQGFVTVYNGTSSSGASSLLSTFVSPSASGDTGVSVSGDAGMPVGATYGLGGKAYASPVSVRGSGDGTGAGFAVLYPNGSVTFLYFGADGSPRGSPQTVLYQTNPTGDGDEVQVTNFGGTFAVSLYSTIEHLTRMVAPTCQ